MLVHKNNEYINDYFILLFCIKQNDVQHRANNFTSVTSTNGGNNQDMNNINNSEYVSKPVNKMYSANIT